MSEERFGEAQVVHTRKEHEAGTKAVVICHHLDDTEGSSITWLWTPVRVLGLACDSHEP